eukprot:CAMPEP_0114569836 /NCGR_PEP_ID=MMETSP0114-20121206/16855_1 /TAXON_ID=31324 /ORGANISM="Goniomonas sp, Strain m" /LENGTH=54 /DNA_ID=CAMNT_0001756775 /DNA_START=29 /DNA_END=190 /DNA_ORIENTATION=-
MMADDIGPEPEPAEPSLRPESASFDRPNTPDAPNTGSNGARSGGKPEADVGKKE